MQKKNRGMIMVFVSPGLLFFITAFVYPIIQTIMMRFLMIDNVTVRMSQWSFAGLVAVVVIVFLPTFFLYIFLSGKIIAGVTAGGVKG